MKDSKLLRRSRILLIYRYFVLEGINSKEKILKKLFSEIEMNYNDFIWFKDFLSRENNIYHTIDENLKEGWKFKRIPLLEKALLAFSIDKLERTENWNQNIIFLFIKQIVKFGEKYLGSDKSLYIRRILLNTANKLTNRRNNERVLFT